MASFFLTKENNNFKIIIDESFINILIDDLSPYSKFFGVTFELTSQFVIGSISDHEKIKPFLKNEYFSLTVQLSHKKNELNNSIKLNEWLTANKILRNYFLSIDDINKYRPLELNYDLLRVTFDQGCYRGQEIVARMKYLGVDRRSFLTFITTSEYAANENIKVIGKTIKIEDKLAFNVIVKKDLIPEIQKNPHILKII